jgi:hypothetical protein
MTIPLVFLLRTGNLLVRCKILEPQNCSRRFIGKVTLKPLN